MSTASPELLADQLVRGDFHQPDMIETLTEMARRGESAQEICALASAFRRAAVPVITKHPVVLDMCGTGGARFRTFNVSTAASFVVAALGVPVAKHGNRSARGCGSADVLEALGARIALSPEEAGRSLDELGFAFLFAPSFHPAMRHAASVRRQIGSRTVFNMLGPLLNPVAAGRRQLMGVYSPHLLEVLPPVLIGLGVESALIVHGSPGMDEVSVVGSTSAVQIDGDQVHRFRIDPRRLGMYHPDPEEVAEVPVSESARAVLEVLGGAVGARRDMVVLNAACGLVAFGAVRDLDLAIKRCEAAIDSGKALAKLHEYTARTGRHPPG